VTSPWKPDPIVFFGDSLDTHGDCTRIEFEVEKKDEISEEKG
jgi:hypothetical protein